MSRPIVIVGAGGHGRELLDVVEAVNDDASQPDGRWNFLGFLDDGAPDTMGRGPVLGPVGLLVELDVEYVVGVGDPRVRQRIDQMSARQAAVLVHPSASVGPDVVLGPGTVLTAGSRVTNHVRTGRHVHLNLNATASHDSVLGDYVTLNPGASVAGGVLLGDGVTIGMGAVVTQQRRVGAWATVGAGAVVVRDLPGGVTAVGVPARPLST